MITTNELFADKTYPSWITTHHVFNRLKYIRKVFPELGLPNFSESIAIDNSKEVMTFTNQLLSLIGDLMAARSTKLIALSKKGTKIGKKRRANLALLVNVMGALAQELRTNQSAFINRADNGKVSLGLPIDLMHEDVIFMKRGAGLLKLYEKFNSILLENKFLALTPINTTYQFKNFSSINIPAKTTIVKFTSDGKDGIWNIATMSMRGVNSCQSWDGMGGGQSGKVIGSMIDPFTAIIYLTCGTNINNYGDKMVRRCVVRYMIDNVSKEPYLLLEKMYPAFDKPSLDTFVSVIKKRAPDINVLYSVDIGGKANVFGSKLSHSYIPLSDELKLLDAHYRPYVDSGVAFAEDANCKYTKNTENIKLDFKKRLPALFQAAVRANVFKQTNTKVFGKSATSLISQLRALPKRKPNIPTNKLIAEQNSKLAEEVSTRLGDVICNKPDCVDPYKYLSEHSNVGVEFLASEFGDKISAEFAQFMTTNIASYIRDHSF